MKNKIEKIESETLNIYRSLFDKLTELSNLNKKSKSSNLEATIMNHHYSHGCRTKVEIKGNLI